MQLTRLVPGCRISALVVDDVSESRDMLASMLKHIGATVREAKNGLEALCKIQVMRPDIVFMDIRMPIMDGMETLLKLRQQAQGSTLPCIAMSASRMDCEMEAYMALGFDYFIGKPFRLSDVRDCLRFFLSAEFEPDEAVLAGESTVARCPWQDALVPGELYRQLFYAAEHDQQTELHHLLAELGAVDGACHALAVHLESLVSLFDRVAVEATLRDVRHG